MAKPLEIDQGIVFDPLRDLYIVSGSALRKNTLTLAASNLANPIKHVDLVFFLEEEEGHKIENTYIKVLIKEVILYLQKFNNSQKIETMISTIMADIGKDT